MGIKKMNFPGLDSMSEDSGNAVIDPFRQARFYHLSQNEVCQTKYIVITQWQDHGSHEEGNLEMTVGEQRFVGTFDNRSLQDDPSYKALLWCSDHMEQIHMEFLIRGDQLILRIETRQGIGTTSSWASMHLRNSRTRNIGWN